MKKLLLLLLLNVCFSFCFGQDNPYAIFGYKDDVKYKDSKEDIYWVKNINSNSKIKILKFDFGNHLVSFLDQKDSTLATIKIASDQILRFLSPDPLTGKYPELTPYQFASNRPIDGIDQDGLEYYYAANGKFLGQGSDPKNLQVRLGQITGKTIAGENIITAVDISGHTEKQWTVINQNYPEFKRLAGVLYAAGSATWKEAAGIYSVLKNRADLDNSTVSKEATVTHGVYGASTADKISSKVANKTFVENAFRGLIAGTLNNHIDYSNGAFFWDGKDFNGDNKNHGGYTARYKPGYLFTNTADDLWDQGNNKKPGKTSFGTWDYKYQSTTTEGNTTFSKLTDAWRDAQFPGTKKANEMGGKP